MFEQIISLKVKQEIGYKEYKLSKLLRVFACLVCEEKQNKTKNKKKDQIKNPLTIKAINFLFCSVLFSCHSVPFPLTVQRPFFPFPSLPFLKYRTTTDTSINIVGWKHNNTFKSVFCSQFLCKFSVRTCVYVCAQVI